MCVYIERGCDIYDNKVARCALCADAGGCCLMSVKRRNKSGWETMRGGEYNGEFKILPNMIRRR